MLGSLSKRKDGVYLIRLSVGYRNLPNGKRKRKYKVVTFHGTEKEAQRKRRELVQQFESGGVIDSDKAPLQEFLQEWLRLCKSKARKATKRVYTWAIDEVIGPAIGDLQLSRVTPMDIQNFYNELEEGHLGTSGLNTCHTVLNQGLRQAVRWRRLARNPMDGVDKPKARETREEVVRVLSPDELRQFLTFTRTLRDGLLFRWASHSGARPGEYLGLTWAAVDWERGGWRVERALTKDVGEPAMFGAPKTKTSKRWISMPPHLMGELRQHRIDQLKARLARGDKWKDTDLVFPNRDGWFRCEPAVNRRFKTLMQRLEFAPDLDLYTLRHTHATEMLRLGKAPKVVQARLGHSSIRETMDTYSHVDDAMAGDAAEEFGRAYPH